MERMHRLTEWARRAVMKSHANGLTIKEIADDLFVEVAVVERFVWALQASQGKVQHRIEVDQARVVSCAKSDGCVGGDEWQGTSTNNMRRHRCCQCNQLHYGDTCLLCVARHVDRHEVQLFELLTMQGPHLEHNNRTRMAVA